MSAIRRDELVQDDVVWIDIRVAAARLKTSVAALRVLVADWAVEAIEWDGVQWVSRAAVMKRQREVQAMRRIDSGKPMRDAAGRPVGSRWLGQSRPDEGQPVLPITSGRGGRGWIG